MDEYLADLEKRSISLIREAKAQFKNPAVQSQKNGAST